jgi:hypothetical protein
MPIDSNLLICQMAEKYPGFFRRLLPRTMAAPAAFRARRTAWRDCRQIGCCW